MLLLIESFAMNVKKKKEKNRMYRKKHKEELKERRKEYDDKYHSTKKGQKNLHNGRLKRRERMNNISHSFTYDEWLNKLRETNGICSMCSKNVGIGNLTLDHIIPISKAKENFVYSINDAQSLCKSCNCSKGDSI